MDEFLEKRKANKDSPACLVIDGKITVLAVKINLEKSLDGLQQTNTTYLSEKDRIWAGVLTLDVDVFVHDI